MVKHSQIVKQLYVSLGSLFFKFIGLFIAIDEKLILIVPNTGKTFNGSPRDIYEEIKSRTELSDYRVVWAFLEPEKMGSTFNLQTVKIDSFAYFLTSLKAKYWIADINVERGLHYRQKETIFLNTWHGVAIKKIGNDDPKSARYDYSNIDFLCVSGSYDEQVFQSALGATAKSFLRVGMPRNDALLVDNPSNIRKIRQDLGIAESKKVILYVPTWRDSKDNGRSYQLDIPADFSSWYQQLNEEYVLLFRAHSRTTSLLGVEFSDTVIDCSEYPDLNDLLLISDVLVSDYSSVIFDYSLLNRPYFCFGYDYEDYLVERGWYIEPERVFPYGVIKTEEALLDRINNYDADYVSKFIGDIRNRYMNYTDGQATSACVDALFRSELYK